MALAPPPSPSTIKNGFIFYAGNACLADSRGTFSIRLTVSGGRTTVNAVISRVPVTMVIEDEVATISWGSRSERLALVEQAPPAIPGYTPPPDPKVFLQAGSYAGGAVASTGATPSEVQVMMAKVLLSTVVPLCTVTGLGIPPDVKLACGPLTSSQVASFTTVPTGDSDPAPTGPSPACKAIRQKMQQARIAYAHALMVYTQFGCYTSLGQNRLDCLILQMALEQIRDYCADLYAQSLWICSQTIDPIG